MTRPLRPLFPRSYSRHRRIAFLALPLVGLVVVLGLPAAAFADAPIVSTSDAVSTDATHATVEDVISPGGQITSYVAQWDLNSSTWCQTLGALTAGTHYCAQLIATNGSGEGDGGTVDWTQPVSVTVSPAGSGSGTVTSTPAGVNCGATCSLTLPVGTVVMLTAIPAAGSTFAGWSGGGCSGIGVCKLTLNANTAVTATFTIAFVPTLTVSKAGTGSGTVTSSPAGIDCGSICTQAFDLGAQVTLTAAADPGSTFSGWSGGGCSCTGTCVVTPNADTDVTATFALSPPPPTKCIVPKVKGKEFAAAKRSIKSHHCSVGKITKVSSSQKNKGRVISQSPKPGKKLEKGSKVAFKVGK